jgi:hypothetical protein
MASALNTRIERIPGERKHSVEFLALVDERVIAVCTTRDEAQDALNAYRFDSFRRHQATSEVDLLVLHTALTERHLRDAAAMIAPLAPPQLDQVARAYCDHLNERHGFEKFSEEKVCRDFQNAVRKYQDGLYA